MASTPTLIVAYLALFATVGFLFVFAALLLGRFLRAKAPTPEKREVYECGEPPIGSSFVQFDLRFYVVALLFIIFEVEVAFFFPWATVFGKATQLMDPNFQKVVMADSGVMATGRTARLNDSAKQKHLELGVMRPELPEPSSGVERNTQLIESQAGRLALTAIADIGIFFAVLLVGFAYVWKQGDLNWVRAPSRRVSGESGRVERPAAGVETP